MRCHSMPRGIRKFVALAMTWVMASAAVLSLVSHEVAASEAVSRPVLGFQEGLIAAMKDAGDSLL